MHVNGKKLFFKEPDYKLDYLLEKENDDRTKLKIENRKFGVLTAKHVHALFSCTRTSNLEWEK